MSRPPETVERVGFADEAEVDDFVRTLARFERGEITPDQWRAYRLVRGIYGQRQEGLQMVRCKIPQGILEAHQLRALAAVARRFSRGFGHITTRQNLQLHFVQPDQVPLAMRLLAEAGLTTREACGNSVRNITACVYAGVAADEVFDVTPFAEACTRYLLRHPLSAALPRKFKIAWEGCRQDHVVLPIHDLGFRARLDESGTPGFQVLVGGGTSILCRQAREIVGFLPAEDALRMAEAVLGVYHQRGDYQHRQRNRLKFLIDSMGFAAFGDEVRSRLRQLRAEGGAPLPLDARLPRGETPPARRGQAPSAQAIAARVRREPPRGPGLTPVLEIDTQPAEAELARWLRNNVRPQKQAGFSLVTVAVSLGDLTAPQLEVLADLALAYGDGSARVTSEQNLVFRFVPDAEVSALYRRLAAAGLGSGDAGTVADVVSCPGAESCRLAVTQSRGLGRLLGDHLRSQPRLAAAVPGLDLKISGCPNGCSRHHIAGLGFQGSLRRMGKQLLPQYFVLAGGGVDETGVHFGRTIAKVPARRMPEVVERLIALFQAEGQPGEAPAAFFRRLTLERARELLSDLERFVPDEAQRDDFVDLGVPEETRLEILEGECSA